MMDEREKINRATTKSGATRRGGMAAAGAAHPRSYAALGAFGTNGKAKGVSVSVTASASKSKTSKAAGSGRGKD
jgi:hypothetical protein